MNAATTMNPIPFDDLGPPSFTLPQPRSILGQKYWKSQQQASTVTGKYLRPMCEVVSGSASMLDHRLPHRHTLVRASMRTLTHFVAPDDGSQDAIALFVRPRFSQPDGRFKQYG